MRPPIRINADKKSEDDDKPVEVVFVVEGDHVKTVPVKIGISDDNYWEITDGLKEGDEIVTGGYHAISRDLDDGKKIVKGTGRRRTNSLNIVVSLIRLQKISRRYQMGAETVHALREVRWKSSAANTSPSWARPAPANPR